MFGDDGDGTSVSSYLSSTKDSYREGYNDGKINYRKEVISRLERLIKEHDGDYISPLLDEILTSPSPKDDSYFCEHDVEEKFVIHLLKCLIKNFEEDKILDKEIKRHEI